MKNDYSVSFAFAEATQSLRSFGVKELFLKKILINPLNP